MGGSTVGAVSVAALATKQLVEHDQLIVLFAVVVRVVIVHDLVAVGVGVFTDSGIAVSAGAFTCLNSAEGVTGRAELAIMVVCPSAISDGNILTGNIGSNSIANSFVGVFLTGVADI